MSVSDSSQVSPAPMASPGATTADGSGSARLAPAGHVFGLDLLRIVAAVLVALFHLTWRYEPLAVVPPAGWIGVQVFFVLSGFVIAGSVMTTSPAAFLRNRALRLYPGAWIAAALGLATISAFGGAEAAAGVVARTDPASILSSLTLFGDGFVGSAFWTLQVEIAFYLAVAVVVRDGSRKRLEFLAKALILWSVPMAALMGLELAAGSAPGGAVEIFAGYGPPSMTLVRHGFYFGLGILLWLGASGAPAKNARAWMTLGAALAAIEIADRSAEIAAKAAGGHDAAAVFAVGLALWIAGCAAIELSIRRRAAFPASPTLRRLARTFGLASYPLYLLHEAVGGNLMAGLIGTGAPGPLALIAALVMVGALSVAVATRGEPAIRRLLAGRLAPAGTA